MRCIGTSISLQEIPGEISLVFQISNCPYRCPGCHSPELWKDQGDIVSFDFLESKITPYERYITSVVFFGGENDFNFSSVLKYIKKKKLKTCLYTGADDVSDEIRKYLDFLKLGPYIEEFGGLQSITTNQRFWNLNSNTLMNELFMRDNTQSLQNTNTHERGETDVKFNQGTGCGQD